MKAGFKKMIGLSLAATMGFSLVACGDGGGGGGNGNGGNNDIVRTADTRQLTDIQYTDLNLSGVDELGRVFLPANDEDTDLYVGMFFFLTLGQHSDQGVYDIREITDNYTNMDKFFLTNDETSPVGSGHFWGKPIWDYYRSEDEWVIRRQIEMLTMAGIDFLVFDTTNAVMYDTVVDVVVRVLEEYRLQGFDVPQFMYYCASNDKACIKHVYNKFYKDELYKELWFAPEGKPMITKMRTTTWDTSNAEELAISETFHFRERQWPTDSFLLKGLPWVEWEYPQRIHTDFVNVSCAQHTAGNFSNMSDNWGKGYDRSRMVNDSSLVAEGVNYQWEWKTVLENEKRDRIKYVLCTQWNEWTATKFWLEGATQAHMVDNFTEEYSRDMEPCYDGYGDNYYMQTIQNLRKFKYAEATHYNYPEGTIDVSDFTETQWSGINAYMDFAGEAVTRDYMLIDGSPIVNDTNRNDLVSVKVCRDSEYVYFRITTKDAITSYNSGDTKWMNVYIDTGIDGDNLLGYQYKINHAVNGNKTAVCKYNGSSWLQVEDGLGDIYVEGNVMQIKVKLSTLGLTKDNCTFSFKVTDNVTYEQDRLSYYNTGDSAPIGSLSYTFGY